MGMQPANSWQPSATAAIKASRFMARSLPQNTVAALGICHRLLV